MPRRHPTPALALAALLVAAGGCSTLEVVRPPLRNADLYPLAETHQGVTIAVDEIGPARAERYFGRDLSRHGVRPVQVVVSNQGDRRIRVAPSDLLLLRGRKVIDPLPLDWVIRAVGDGLVTTEGTEKRIASYFRDLALEERVVAPGESYQGIVFFQAEPRKESRRDRYFRVASLFPQPSLRLRLVATDLEEDERIPFGPFGLGAGDRGI